MGYRHAVDKSLIPTVNILGVDIAAIDMNRLLDFTHEHIKALSGDYICASNVHTTITAYEDADYLRVQNGGILAIPDGGPLSSVGRMRKADMHRTAGPDYMKEILKASAAFGYRHYFYGSTDETLEKLRTNLQNDYPGIIIAGMYSPPFRDAVCEEDPSIIEQINRAEPDFLWVGLGAPKQERWMAIHQGKVRGLMVGVGAAFDFCAGNVKRAPVWMQKTNLEWLYRFLQEPRRLFRRYLITNTKFIWHAIVRGR